ncbi:hypothetical protein K469DRAFT_600180, partial [Zopfia rhizophila CBS 207.26]
TRVWVIQEFVLGRTVTLLYGHKRFSWTNINKNWLADDRSLIWDLFSLKANRRRAGGYDEGDDRALTSLSNALHLASTSNAINPRDKVYAVLGLLQEGYTGLLKPDYTLSPCEAFCRALQVMSSENR